MLSIFIILIVVWLLGVVTDNTLGGFIHIVLAVALVMVTIRFIQIRREIR